MRLRVLLSFLPIVVAACTRPDTLYCDQNTPCTDPARPFCDLTGEFSASDGVGRTCIADPGQGGQPDAGDGVPDATAMCTESSECSAELPICRGDACEPCVLGATGNAECSDRNAALGICASDGSCVECGSNADCSSDGEPICDITTGSCGTCSEHLQCDSGACDSDSGICVDEGDIIYVDSTSGSDGAGCGAAPGTGACKHLGGVLGGIAKVTGGRDLLVLASGNYVENVTMSAVALRIIGNGARLFPPGFVPASPLSLTMGANVSVEDMIIEGGNAVGSGVGVSCLSSTLELFNVTVRDNDDAGITSENCTLSLRGTTVRDNGQEGVQLRAGSALNMRESSILENGFHGLHARSSDVDIRQSRFSGNETGGLYLFDSTFVVENNVIAKNGNLTMSPGNPTGGIVVETVPGPALSPQNIRHNTIAHNLAPAAVGAAGLVCNSTGGTDAVRCDSNIVVGNERPGIDEQTAGNCAIRYSSVTGISSGVGNISVEPVFVNANTGDYHLAVGSPGIDIADPSSPTTVDIDGDARPSGTGYDMGADER